jgi:hypothetical protein
VNIWSPALSIALDTLATSGQVIHQAPTIELNANTPAPASDGASPPGQVKIGESSLVGLLQGSAS